ncbi:MAG: hypothetical protein Q4G50_00830 [Corynebacterium sp.]|uniref:hypothetical protein n=1 Tax=Corynebacterium sp. TaxID=1720 RepID=UPI0026DF7628|nr:hypothetical protein [Corynebacterium sp.]MDO5668526.1 hypothetical protein [Corynebacterium sp.]
MTTLFSLPDDPAEQVAHLLSHIAVSDTFSIPLNDARPQGLVHYGARFHPRGLAYSAPATARAVAHHLERPGSIIAEWSALDILGVPDFSDAADTTLLCSSDRRLTRSPLQPTVRRRTKKHRTLERHVGSRKVMVTDHLDTLAGCLRSLENGEHAWDTLATLDIDPITIMSVQVIDRFRRVFGASTDQLRTGLKGKIRARRLEALLLLSCALTDSKPETVLRLLAREAVADLPEVQFQSQIPVYADGEIGRTGEKSPDKTLLTILDQAAAALKVGLQQDGEHHLERKQRDKDAEITADLLSTGWQLVRTSTGMLRKTSETKRRIRAAALRALHARGEMAS